MHELTMRRDVRGGVREAWYYVKLYMIQAVFAIGLGGYVLLRRFPLLAIALLPLYIVGGLAAGAIAGYLLPWCTRPLGAAVTGVVAILPFFVVLGLFFTVAYPFWAVVSAILICALFYGSVGGVVLWRAYVKK